MGCSMGEKNQVLSGFMTVVKTYPRYSLVVPDNPHVPTYAIAGSLSSRLLMLVMD